MGRRGPVARDPNGWPRWLNQAGLRLVQALLITWWLVLAAFPCALLWRVLHEHGVL